MTDNSTCKCTLHSGYKNFIQDQKMKYFILDYNKCMITDILKIIQSKFASFFKYFFIEKKKRKRI